MTGLELVGLFLAAPTLVEGFLHLFEATMKKMEQHKNMRSQAEHLKAFMVDVGRIRLEKDTEVARRILNDRRVDKHDKEHVVEVFNHAMSVLSGMDANANDILEKTDTLFSRKKRLALTKLIEQVRDLEFTLATFHDMVISLSILQASNSLLFLGHRDFTIIGLKDRRRQLNNNTFITTARLSRTSQDAAAQVQNYVFEEKPYGGVHPVEAAVKEDLELLARRLSAAKFAEGILPLVGFRHEPVSQNFQLIFKIEDTMMSGQTLRHYFRSCEETPSLNFRVGLCASLAEATVHVHTLGLVHKNIRPENIFLVPASVRGSPQLYLLNWQYAREAEDFQTLRVGELLLERRIYQHPQRQIQCPEHDYCMSHDVYSLGVCLLEVLLWTPLLDVRDDGKSVMSQQLLANISELNQEGPSDSSELHTPSPSSSSAGLVESSGIRSRSRHRPRKIQQALMEIGRKKLPTSAGNRMAEIVARCIMCLDPDEGDERLWDQLSCSDPAVGDKAVSAHFANTVLKDIRSIHSSI